MSSDSYANRVWTDESWSLAMYHAQQGLCCDEISDEIGMTRNQVFDKFQFMRRKGFWKEEGPPSYRERADNGLRSGPMRVTPKAIEDRDRRADLRAQQNTTAAFFGDPPPGYSALCKKTRAEAR